MVKTLCEVYSRVVGYIRPVSNWNDSKQQEFHDRKMFNFGGNGNGKQMQIANKSRVDAKE